MIPPEIQQLLDDADRLLAEAGQLAPPESTVTGFDVIIYGTTRQDRLLLRESLAHPWSPEAKAQAIRTLGGLIRAISGAEEFPAAGGVSP